ncbi:MAG: hypothetical protein KDB27_22235, partial [Planctomycetales bacterium]|nr:hypothetical protein [Planctomycetales bacterium]
MSHRKIALAVCALAACGYSVYRLYAQDPGGVNPPAGPTTFASLVAADEAAEGRTKADSAQIFADWMKTNQWQNMPMEDQRVLVDKLDLDEVDFPNFSARWTGSLTAAETGEYTFVQGKQLKKTSPMKVWMNDKLELDSSTGASESKPISLQAGQAVSIRVEVTHDSFYRVGYSEGAPIAVLAWKQTGQSPQLIPSSAYTPPVGFADGENGLKGEYFASTNHGGSTLKSTQLDPGVEFSWAWSPVVATYGDETKAVKAKLWDQLETGQAFTDRANDKAKFLDDALWQT